MKMSIYTDVDLTDDPVTDAEFFGTLAHEVMELLDSLPDEEGDAS